MKIVRQAKNAMPGSHYSLLAIALDTKGPEIRTGVLAGDPNKDIVLTTGQKIKLTTDEALKDKVSTEVVYLDYKNIVKVVKPGSRVFIDDGLLCLVVNAISTFHHNGFRVFFDSMLV